MRDAYDGIRPIAGATGWRSGLALVRRYDVIAIETLNVKGMAANPALRTQVLDAGFATFARGRLGAASTARSCTASTAGTQQQTLRPADTSAAIWNWMSAPTYARNAGCPSTAT